MVGADVEEVALAKDDRMTERSKVMALDCI